MDYVRIFVKFSTKIYDFSKKFCLKMISAQILIFEFNIPNSVGLGGFNLFTV